MKKKVCHEELLKAKSRKISIAEGSAFSVMDGFGLKYITPYAVAIGMSNFLIGVLSSLPALLGSFSQLKSSKLIESKSRKKIVFWSVFFQVLMWLPIIFVGYAYFFLGLKTIYASLLLILFYTLLILFNAFAAPAWNSWMRDLVTKDTGSYFGKRSGITGTVGLISMFAAGFVLSYFKNLGDFYGFAVIFSVALLGRGLSAYFFTKQYEPRLNYKEGYYFSFGQFLKKMRKNNFGRFVIFSSLVSFATMVAAPFFSVFMLKNLNFDYLQYTIIITVPVVMTLFLVPLWGKFGDKYGNIKVLRICGSLIFTIPLFWFFSIFLIPHQEILLWYLIIVEVFSGIIWAGFNLSTATFVFQAVTKERLPLCVAYSSILNALGAFLGASLGGLISSFEINLFGLNSILFAFLLSAILRFAFFFGMIGKLKEVLVVEDFEVRELKDLLTRVVPRPVFDTLGVKRN